MYIWTTIFIPQKHLNLNNKRPEKNLDEPYKAWLLRYPVRQQECSLPNGKEEEWCILFRYAMSKKTRSQHFGLHTQCEQVINWLLVDLEVAAVQQALMRGTIPGSIRHRAVLRNECGEPVERKWVAKWCPGQCVIIECGTDLVHTAQFAGAGYVAEVSFASVWVAGVKSAKNSSGS
ncbi:hypothetical protein B0H10DRAFT_1950755 [Mycena sp. CBHHK59/15]|nr:hypothetical protein B0H10DRAFT_1950755 [Mycena sp. CBHHK59/15]